MKKEDVAIAMEEIPYRDSTPETKVTELRDVFNESNATVDIICRDHFVYKHVLQKWSLYDDILDDVLPESEVPLLCIV